MEIHHPEKKNVLLSGLNISVKSSETLAIVGTTDFNSNAVIALVERFYDPTAGFIVSIGRLQLASILVDVSKHVREFIRCNS